jgi:hypothetical protein
MNESLNDPPKEYLTPAFSRQRRRVARSVVPIPELAKMTDGAFAESEVILGFRHMRIPNMPGGKN